MKPPRSLQWRAALAVVLAFGAVFVLLFASISYRSLKEGSGEIDVTFLRATQGFAQAMDLVDSAAQAQQTLALVARINEAGAAEGDPPSHLFLAPRDGGPTLATPGAWPLDVRLLQPGVGRVQQGAAPLRVYVADGARWRVVTAQLTEKRSSSVLLEVAGDLLLYLAMALPIMLLPVWFSVRMALKPLRELATTVAARSPGDTRAVGTNTSYRELQPLEQALNRQFAQAAESIQREKAFVHDAAHELRTPLAVIAAQAHVLAESDGPARAQARRQLEAAVTRASHLAHQLLKLAQADATSRGTRQPVDLMNLARDALALVAARAAAQGTELSLQGPDHALLQSDSQALRSILDNLLDNALRYGGPGGTVDVSVQVLESGLQLQVADSGPGIRAEERERVFERFWRGAAVDQPGTGLGLAIVREAARGLGGDAQVAQRPGQPGCAVVVRLP